MSKFITIDLDGTTTALINTDWIQLMEQSDEQRIRISYYGGGISVLGNLTSLLTRIHQAEKS